MLKNKRKTFGLISTLIGFSLIVLNGAGYLFRLNISTPGLLILGITFFIIGGLVVSKPISEQINS